MEKKMVDVHESEECKTNATGSPGKEASTLLGFSPIDFRLWADNLEANFGLDSQLVRFLRDLAEKLEGDRIKET